LLDLRTTKCHGPILADTWTFRELLSRLLQERPRTRHLALQHRELMTEHGDLDILLVRHRTDSDESE